MHCFVLEDYFNIKDVQNKIEYLNNCVDNEIILENIDYKHYNAFHCCYNNDLYLAMARKRFTYNNKSVLISICNTSRDNINVITSALEIYEKNRWIETENEKSVIDTIYSYGDSTYPRDIKIYDYIIGVYDRLEIPFNNILNNIIVRMCSLDNFLRMLKIYKERNFQIDSNIFIKFINTKSSNYQIKDDLLDELIDFCITNNLHIYNVDKITYEWQSNEIIIMTLHKLLDITQNWNIIKKVFDFYQDKDYPINEENTNILEKMGNLNLEAIEYIINYWHSKGISYNINNETFIKEIISNNSVEVLRYIMKMGAKPIDYIDSIYKLYIPCPHCYNGELSRCNYRNVSLEYILLSRYKIKIKDLENSDILDKLENTESVEFDYSEFEGDADDNEIYVEPRIPANIIYRK